MTDGAASSETMKCPWCAEEIRSEAKKCKFCGEFLSDERPTRRVNSVASGQESDIPTASDTRSGDEPVWLRTAGYWQCIAHGKIACPDCLEIVNCPSTGSEGQLFPVRLRVDEQLPKERPFGQGVHPPEVEELVRLGALHVAGKISTEEWEAARAPLLAALPSDYTSSKGQSSSKMIPSQQSPYPNTMGTRTKSSLVGAQNEAAGGWRAMPNTRGIPLTLTELLRYKSEQAKTEDANLVCPHCRARGNVRTIRGRTKKGISGGKATAAFLTFGLSIGATGLSRKQMATRAKCGNCGASWDF